MKTIFISLFLLTAGSLYAVQTDSLDVEKSKSGEVVREDKSAGDELGGKEQLQQKKSKRRMDVFIDKDGDGISDQRASGMGLDKMRKRFRGGKGGGQGQGQGGDGNGPGGR